MILFTAILNFIGIGGLITSVIMIFINLFIKKQVTEMEKRGDIRIQENYIMMRYMQSLGSLTYATGIAVKDGRVNGEMTEAIENFRDAKEDLDCFLIKQNAELLHKK
jgi:hypothetical protein